LPPRTNHRPDIVAAGETMGKTAPIVPVVHVLVEGGTPIQLIADHDEGQGTEGPILKSDKTDPADGEGSNLLPGGGKQSKAPNGQGRQDDQDNAKQI